MKLLISDNPKLAMKARVFVDGVDVSRWCYGADEERGEAYCYVGGDNGMIAVHHTDDCIGTNCTMDTHDGCHLLRETRRGLVRIEVPAAA